MFKKILKVLGSFLLVLLVIIIGFIIWMQIEKSNQEKSATPYLEKNMPIFVSWNYEKMKQILASEALEAFETEQGKRVYKTFSKLGKFIYFEKPEYVSTTVNSNNKFVTFKMIGHFENEDALLHVKLVKNNESYQVSYVRINSNIFLAK